MVYTQKSLYQFIQEKPGIKRNRVVSHIRKSYKKLSKKNAQEQAEVQIIFEPVGPQLKENDDDDDDDGADLGTSKTSKWPYTIIPWWTSTNCEDKPLYPFNALIAHAILTSKHGRLTVSEIYEWIIKNYPYYKTNDPRWKNSVRQNLSTKPGFVKEIRRPTRANPKKGSYWKVDNSMEQHFIDVLCYQDRRLPRVNSITPFDLESIDNSASNEEFDYILDYFESSELNMFTTQNLSNPQNQEEINCFTEVCPGTQENDDTTDSVMDSTDAIISMNEKTISKNDLPGSYAVQPKHSYFLEESGFQSIMSNENVLSHQPMSFATPHISLYMPDSGIHNPVLDNTTIIDLQSPAVTKCFHHSDNTMHQYNSYSNNNQYIYKITEHYQLDEAMNYESNMNSFEFFNNNNLVLDDQSYGNYYSLCFDGADIY